MFNPGGHGAQIPGSSSFGGGLFEQPGGGMGVIQQQQQPTGMMGMPTGMGMGTGMGGIQPQMTGYNPFLQQQQQQQMMMQPQQTGFLQPQATGFNPFRQSMMMPQATGMGMGMGEMGIGMNGMQQSPQPQQQLQSQAQPPVSPQPSQLQSQTLRPGLGSLGSISEDLTGNGQSQSNGQPSSGLTAFNSAFSQQPSSMPLSPSASSSGPATSSSSFVSKPIVAQKTGSRNPFAPPPGSTPPPSPPPAGPKGPSLNQLAFSAFGNGQTGGGAYGLGAGGWDPNSQLQSQQSPQPTGLQPQQTGLIGSVASEFAFSKPQTNGTTTSPAPTQSTLPTATGSTNGFSSTFSSLSLGGPSSSAASPTNLNTSTNNPFPSFPPSTPQPQQAIQPQATGFGGSSVLPFKPSSSFGASLATQLPGQQTQQQPLSAQMTGNNPFTAFTNNQNGSLTPNHQQSSLSPQPTGYQGSSNVKPFQPTSSFGQQQLQQQQTGQAQNAQFGSLF